MLPPQYSHMYWCYPSTVLNSLHSTNAIPPQYLCYPPHVLMLSLSSTAAIPLQYWIASTVLTLSPTCTAAIPSQYWTASAVLLIFLRSADAIPPQCLCYSPQYWCYPPHVLILSPHSTEQLPQYWTASAVLNRRYTGWSGHNKLADCIEIGNGKSSIKKRIFYRGSESFPLSFVRSSESFHSGNFLINMDFWFCWKSS